MSSPLDRAWTLTPSVAIRPETFGGLAYNFSNRKMVFLKRPKLVEVVRLLDRHPDARSALRAAGVPTCDHVAYGRAVEQLASSDMIRLRRQV
ncbi:mycofactocin biosynthesis chaperone MftB [Nocardioides KLBMP 9356]|uniref:Mycofactocin biosynthesis chaperone MftB n=1 Tax=Nocardioides potassii TaxID=2911371 RepID=A0ABS9HCA2_9ACTN|nr:mycofactocin biosynthesis chaperone MftB [Nocardioides potassii]MCF6378129.1 mycofactocin biosynthesis chaperone MftB [Nocardioides potassii]